MSAKRSKRKPAKAVHGEPIPAGSTGRKHPLRVPQLKDGEGIADLLPDEEALIQLEITQRTARQWSRDDVAN